MTEPPNDDYMPTWEEDEEARQRGTDREVDAAAQNIAAGFVRLRDALGPDEAYRLLNIWLKQVRPSRKPKGKHRPDRDAAILAAYDDAPQGYKERRAIAAGIAHGSPSEDAAKRQLYRLRAERDSQGEALVMFRELCKRRQHRDN